MAAVEIPRDEQAFLEYVQAGGQVETADWMPDDYRAKLIKFVEMHGNSELMGVLPEREWILRAPTLQRKLALTAKVQDEVGHAQLIYRVVEDLGKPREQCLADLISGKSKFHNVFHYPTRTWGDVGVIAWLVDAAAIISQKALLKCSYAPYARIMKKICWEESFHILHGRDVDPRARHRHAGPVRARAGGADRWWGPLMQFHGNPIPRDEDPMWHWRIKIQGNEEARQQFLDGYVPQILELGLEIPDPKLRKARRHLAVHRAGLGRAAQRRHRPRPDDRRAARVPGALPRPGALGAARRWPRRERVAGIWEVFRQERKGQPFEHAGSVVAPDGDVRRGVGARAVRPPRRVGRALARAARGDPAGRRLGGRVRPQVPAGGRLLDQGAAEGGAGACRRRGLSACSSSPTTSWSSAGTSRSGRASRRRSRRTSPSPRSPRTRSATPAPLYELAAADLGTDADALAFDREPAEYRCAPLVELRLLDWAHTIARRWLYETADEVRIAALKDDPDAEVAGPRGEDRPRGGLPPHARRDVARAPARRAALPRGGRRAVAVRARRPAGGAARRARRARRPRRGAPRSSAARTPTTSPSCGTR